MTEPISVALAKSGVDAAFATATPLLQRLLGPAADELGGMVGDWLRPIRMRNVLRGLGRFEAMLVAAKIEPRPVPLRLLSPILDGMSLEDDDDLVTAWAALLSNAAADSSMVRPGFASILADLSKNDALVLEHLVSKYPRHYENGWGTLAEEWSVSFKELHQKLELPETELQLCLSNLQRLGLLEQELPPTRTVGTPIGNIGVLQPTLRASAIGRQFHAACQPPIAVG